MRTVVSHPNPEKVWKTGSPNLVSDKGYESPKIGRGKGSMKSHTPTRNGEIIMTKCYNLKDGTVIREVGKGTFAIVFPNKRYMTVTTWRGKVEVKIPTIGTFDLGDVQY